jgi:hypothetical protein
LKVNNTLPVDNSMTPGNYYLRTIVTGKSYGGEPYRNALQIDFEVSKL